LSWSRATFSPERAVGCDIVTEKELPPVASVTDDKLPPTLIDIAVTVKPTE
jgi:hypothetical protein